MGTSLIQAGSLQQTTDDVSEGTKKYYSDTLYRQSFHNLAVESKNYEYLGFVDRTESEFVINESTLTFTIQAKSPSTTFRVVNSGIVTYYTSESVQWTNTDGIHIFYFTTAGVLAHGTSLPDLTQNAMVCIIHWDVADQIAIRVAEERHGCIMDGQTHTYLHLTRGCVYQSGFDASGFTTSGDGSLNSEVQIGLNGGSLWDEDIRLAITHSATPANYLEQNLSPIAYLPVFYQLGSVFKERTPTAYPLYMATTRPYYNDLSGSPALAEVPDDSYFAMWIVATNAIENPIISLMGQRTDATLVDAKNYNLYGSINFGNLIVPEYKVLYRLIYHSLNTYTNSFKTTLVDVQDTRRQLDSGKDSYIPQPIIVSHAQLGGLSSDDHIQYALLSGRTLGQSLTGGLAASETLTLNGSISGGPVKINTDGSQTIIGNIVPAGANALLVGGNTEATDYIFHGDAVPLSTKLTNKEDSANKSIDGTLAANSDTLFPSQKAVKTYADTKNTDIQTHAASSKTTPITTDEIPLIDSEALYGLKKLTWSNLVTTIQTTFSSVFAAINQTFYIGTTATTVNRASAAQSLTGITSIDGSAATLTTARNIDGQSFNGSADITVIAPGTHAAASKALPVVADEIPLIDSATSFTLKKLTWSNLLSAIVGGTTNQIQYNNGSGFSGSSNLENSTEGHLNLVAIAGNTAVTSPSGRATLFARSKAGRILPVVKSPSGIEWPVQPPIFANKIGWWSAAGNSTTTASLGFAGGTAQGTATAVSVTTTNYYTQMRRLHYVSAATVGALAGIRIATAQWFLGNVAGMGGFFYVIRFGIAAVSANSRMFVGLSASTVAATNVEPNTINNIIGVGKIAASANLQIISRSATAATTTDLGVNFPAATINTAYELRIFAAPNSANVSISVERLDSPQYTEVLNIANPPVQNTLLCIQNWICNNTTAAANTIGISSMYMETDY